MITLQTIIFLTVVLMNVTRKNSSLVMIYLIQSTCVVLLLLLISYTQQSTELLISAILTFLVKVAGVPLFFYRFIGGEQMKLSISTYLSTPATLAALLALTVFARSDIFLPFLQLLPNSQDLLSLSLATILMSMFFIINRKGILSQIVGILCLENAIVGFGSFVGTEQITVLEIGIIFNILLWIVVASIFISIIYSRFKILDVTQLNRLKE